MIIFLLFCILIAVLLASKAGQQVLIFIIFGIVGLAIVVFVFVFIFIFVLWISEGSILSAFIIATAFTVFQIYRFFRDM